MEKSAVSGIQQKPGTRRVMIDLLIALLPLTVASVVFFGLKELVVVAVCVVASMLSEFFFNLIAKKPQTATDLSSAVTGLILALTLPASTTLWQCLVGSVFAIVIVKCAFGGLGKNFANPAVTAKVMLVIAFGISAVSEPVFEAHNTALIKMNDLTITIGVVATAGAILLGAIYLVIRRALAWQIPVVYVAGVFALAFAFGGSIDVALGMVLGGGVLLGGVFMLTDPVTAPKNGWGKAIYALLCALLTVLISRFGKYGSDAVVFAILFMNVISPYIDMIFTKKEKSEAVEEVAE